MIATAVLDASAAVEFVLKTPVGLRCAHHVFENELHAPYLLDIEFLHALRRLTQLRRLDGPSAGQALQDFLDIPVIRHPHTPMLRQMWELRASVCAHDAIYIALAEALEIPLYTCDAKLARAHGHGAQIVLLA